jgi:hypothetical protein
MVFIGIVTDSKSKENISNLIELNKFIKDNNVIFINESNIDNIKNVHFDTIVINSNFNKEEELNVLLQNTKNIIINMDIELDLKELSIKNLNVITYGFNSKSSVTISSVTDDEVLICIQRNICCNAEIVEVQEVKIENNNYDIYDLIIVLILFFLYSSSLEKIHINSIK